MNQRTTSPAQTALRLGVTMLGAFVMALGMALAKHAATGMSSISCVPAIVYTWQDRLGVGLTLGVFTFGLNVSFFVAEVVMLGRRFPLWQLLQLPLVFVLAASVDLWMALVEPNVPADTPLARYLVLAASIVVMALGIYLEIAGDTIMTPPEALIALVAEKRGAPYGNVKVAFDVAFLLIGAALSLWLLGDLTDVREGSIVAAVFTGLMIRVWTRVLKPAAAKLPQGPTPITPLRALPESQEKAA